MPGWLLGALCGVVFGILSVVLMVPMKFEDRRAAMAGAFAPDGGVDPIGPVCQGS